MSYVKEIYEEADQKAREHTLKEVGEDVMIFPCGFAWVELKVQKRDKLGKELEKEDLMKWDDYRKCYRNWIGDYNQSMNHKEEHAMKMAEILSEEFQVKFTFNSRMD